MALRKLQGEIDRTLKKVAEGVETFEEIYDKIQNTSNFTQKEKLEADLKTQIKKLQRLRDQIKTWMTSNEIKDKSALLENRKLIEQQMERFKACEKEMKTKAFSKEGLNSQAKLDPREKEKNETANWLSTVLEELERQVEKTDAESESIRSSGKRGKKDHKINERVSELEHLNERRKWHIGRLEITLRLVQNGTLDPERVNNLKEDIQYFQESNDEEDFEEDDGIYDELNLEEEEDAFGIAADDHQSSLDSASAADGMEATPPTVAAPAPQKVSAATTTTPATATATTTTPATTTGRSPTKDTKSKSTSATQQQLQDDKSVPSKAASRKSSTIDSTSSRPTVDTTTSSAATTPSLAAKRSPATVNATISSSSASTTIPASMATSTTASSTTTAATTSSSSSSSTATNATPAPAPAPAPQLPPIRYSAAAAAAVSQPPSTTAANVVAASNVSSTAPTSTTSAAAPSTTSAVSSPTTTAQSLASIVSPPQVQQSQQPPPAALSPTQRSSTPSSAVRPPTSISGDSVSEQQQQQQQNGDIPTTNEDTNINEKISSPINAADTMPTIPNGDMSQLPLSPNQKSQGSLQQQQQQQVGSENRLPNSLADLVTRFNDAKHKSLHRETDPDAVNQILEAGYTNLPQAGDAEKPRYYVPKNPYSTPPYYPQQPAPHLENPTPRFFQKFNVDTLFYIFYYFPGTYLQYLAAQELKRQSWRFHKQYLTWFQRATEPVTITDEYEQGTYLYFDWEAVWQQRKKHSFKFEYRFLEDN